MDRIDVREALWGDRVRATRTVIAVLFLISCIAYLLVVHAAGIETEVIRDRFHKNAEPLFHGDMPATEYPPLALLFIAIPRIFGSTEWGYETAYVAQMFVFMVIGLLLTSRLARDLEFDERRAMIAYALFTLLMLEFVLDRFDMIVMVFTLASLVMFIEKRHPLAFFLLACGTLLKVYPAMFFPVYMMFMWQGREFRESVIGAATFVLTGLAVIAFCLVFEPDAITSFLGYNGDRPLQVESVAASLLYPLSMVGISDMCIQSAKDPGSFMSDNLRGALPDAVAAQLLPALVICVAAVWVVYFATTLRTRRGMAPMAVACLTCMLMFLTVNKVFSSQYLIWLIAPVLVVCMLSEERGAKRMFVLVALSMVLTQLNFAYNIGYLGGGDSINDLGMMILLVRNLFVIAMLVESARGMLAHLRGRASGDVPEPVATLK